MAQEHTYTIYYSSRDENGVMWCPDCRRVESTISSVFKTNENQTDGPQTNIIYLDRPDWKSPSNKYRQAPWKLNSVPSALKFDAQGAIVARIQDDDILDRGKIARFLGDETSSSRI